MIFNIPPQNVLLFVNLALFVGQIALLYFYFTVWKKRNDAVSDTNRALISSVSDLVTTLGKVLQQSTIQQAVAKAQADEEEFTIG